MKNQIDLLGEKINFEKNRYCKQRSSSYRMLHCLKFPLLILTASLTIILGLDLGDIWWIQLQKNIALVLGAIITLISTLMTFWNIEEYWMHNKLMQHQLEALQLKFEYEKSKGLTNKRVDEIFREFQELLNTQQNYWKNASDQADEGNGN